MLNPPAGNSLGDVTLSAQDHLGMIGFFPPLVQRVADAGGRLSVVEMNPEMVARFIPGMAGALHNGSSTQDGSTQDLAIAGGDPALYRRMLLKFRSSQADFGDRFVLALEASDCARQGALAPEAEKLAVIDYSQPSSERRLWIFDLQRKRLLLRDFVAHGRKSGENFAEAFSNRLGSHQTSLGLFRTAESYSGKHGYSLRMDGLEPGLNDLARERAQSGEQARDTGAWMMAGARERLAQASWDVPLQGTVTDKAWY